MGYHDDTNPYEASILAKLNITEDSLPPVSEFIQYCNDRETLQEHEKQLVENFAIKLTVLEDYKVVNTLTAEYIAKFLDQFCINKANYNILNDNGREMIRSLFESDSKLMSKAKEICKCE